jgi:hypothetical protein
MASGRWALSLMSRVNASSSLHPLHPTRCMEVGDRGGVGAAGPRSEDLPATDCCKSGIKEDWLLLLKWVITVAVEVLTEVQLHMQVVEQPSGTCSVADALEPGRATEVVGRLRSS